jgi:hypothetical protein
MMEAGRQLSRKDLQYARLMSRSAYEKLSPDDKALVDDAIEMRIIFVINDTPDAKKNPFHLTRATFERYFRTDPDDAKRVLDGGYIMIDEIKTHRRVRPRDPVNRVVYAVKENSDIIIAGRVIPRSLIEKHRVVSQKGPLSLTVDIVAYLLNFYDSDRIEERFKIGTFVWGDKPA